MSSYVKTAYQNNRVEEILNTDKIIKQLDAQNNKIFHEITTGVKDRNSISNEIEKLKQKRVDA